MVTKSETGNKREAQNHDTTHQYVDITDVCEKKNYFLLTFTNKVVVTQKIKKLF